METNRKRKLNPAAPRNTRKKQKTEGDEDHKTKVNYELHANQAHTLPVHDEELIMAVCSGNGRYHGNDGNGALKYDPVGVTSIPPYAGGLLAAIRSHRWNSSQYLTLTTKIFPGNWDLSHKVMMVPSISCPLELSNENCLEQLLWAQHAWDRPTFLLVHSCEAQTYKTYCEPLLRKFGVGLVSWSCGNRVGFGLSRLAAQQYAMNFNEERLRIVLCDVNVSGLSFRSTQKRNTPSGRGDRLLNNNLLKQGYASDEDDSDIEGKTGFELHKGRKSKLLNAAGTGAGNPSFEFGIAPKYNSKKGPHSASFNKTRPIEQVVTVRPELQYDPCFITSSEDTAIQCDFLANLNSTEAQESFKYQGSYINKVEFKEFRCGEYIAMRDEYLRGLNHEDDFLIQYNFKGNEKIVQLGELAAVIAAQHHKKQWDIRSLIIEKILLKHKH